jgi:pimeloyl-ACP methyl ester carboxylesterase
MAIAEDTGYPEAVARCVPNALIALRQGMVYEGPTPADPAVLGAISVPVLVLLGSQTKPSDHAAARHVADYVPNARIQEIPGAGHVPELTHPEALAEALTEFFSPAQQPA